MQMICSRSIPFLDPDSLVPGEAQEVLFRDRDNRFVLYLNDGKSPAAEERIVQLDMREALIWLNEAQDEASFWT
jgi:hypothetical protein